MTTNRSNDKTRLVFAFARNTPPSRRPSHFGARPLNESRDKIKFKFKLSLFFVSDEALPPFPSSSCHSSDTAAGELFFFLFFSKKVCDFLQFFVFDRQNMRRRRWKSRPTQIADWS